MAVGRQSPLRLHISLVSGFVQTFTQFIALRCLFSIGMGGIWSQATATALENLPVEARGLASGVLQQGYAVGSLITVIINHYLVPRTTWRSLFRIAFGISTFAAAFRASLPESEVFLRARREEEVELESPVRSKTRVFFHEVGQMLKYHWRRWVYVTLLISGFAFLSRGSQDLYPAFVRLTKAFASDDDSKAMIATIVGDCGAITCVFPPSTSESFSDHRIRCRGGAIAGGLSQLIGRRVTIM